MALAPQSIEYLYQVLEKQPNARVVITTHHKPDADALGSSLALHLFLQKIGYQSTVVSPTDYSHFLKWMPQEETVVNFEEASSLAAQLIEEADFIFCLDFNHLSRINEMGTLVQASKAVKVLIDHHQDPQGFEQYRLWTTNTSSTCELVMQLIESMGQSGAISADIASCLYAGIMADTGSFRFDNVKPETHEKISRLLKAGAQHSKIHHLLHDQFSLNRMQFIGHVLANNLQVLPEYNTALMWVSREELEKYQIITGDTEGLVNYGLSISGIQLAALFVDRVKLVKISFRAQGQFPCNRFSAEHFAGGGHFSAAGGQSTQSLIETVNRFKMVLPQYKNYLSSPSKTL